MWPFLSYPERSPFDVQHQIYDYIIVGGGTAGCVVASRLSEDLDCSVLIIDKGHAKDDIVSRIPLMSQNMSLGDRMQLQGNRWSEPVPSAKGRINQLWGVEGLGGASRVNAMIWTRGFPGDYAAWSEMGLQDWSYEKLEPYFRKIENVKSDPGSKSRGHTGPVELRRFSFPFVWTGHLRNAAHELGLTLGHDVNDPDAPSMGFFNLDTAIDAHLNRISAFSSYLGKSKALQRRDRLTICTGAIATRLETAVEAGIVTGVHITPCKAPLCDLLVKARREVIICSGALCTPQLLMLSGIGPGESSKKLGIPIVKELPAVGNSLFDHYSIPVMMEVPKSESLHLLESILGLWHMILWFFLGKGLLGLSSVTNSMYIRANAVNRNTMSIDDKEGDSTDASLPRNIPDIEIMLIPTNSLERAVPGRNLISIYPTLIQPRGSGCVELQSVNPLDQPRITYPLLSNEHDVKTARLAIRFAMRLGEKLQQSDYPYPATFAFAPGQDDTLLVEWENAAPVEQIPSPAVKSVASPMSPSDRIPEGDPNSLQGSEAVKGATSGCQNTWATVTDEEIDDYAKRVSHPSYHFSGTCPMSKDELSGVVDQQLRVHGFSNLRIADASIFPKIPSCHTMAPVMVVAERCADMVKDTWAGRRSQ